MGKVTRAAEATRHFSTSHDYILIYAKDQDKWSKVRNLLERSESQIKRSRNPDNDPRGPWLQGDNSTAKSASEVPDLKCAFPRGER